MGMDKEKLEDLNQKIRNKFKIFYMNLYFSYEKVFQLFNKKPHPIVYYHKDIYEHRFGKPEDYSFNEPFPDDYTP